MTDRHTREQRSFNMSRIHGTNTSPEVTLRKLLSKSKIKGYRLHYKITGNPDLVFTKSKVAVFIDGCFWHKCPEHFYPPETRKEFWVNKIGSNVKRDQLVKESLEVEGWRVLRFWQHEIKENPEGVLRIIKELT